jgi:chitinase
MRRLARAAAAGALVLLPLAGTTGSRAGASAPPVEQAAPYEYLGWGNPQAPATVLAATGLHSLTLAFILSHKKCNPMWDGSRPLLGGTDAAAIDAIRAAGGDVDVSFGGWSGKKLGTSCKTVAALAAAYQQVIDAYSLRAIDIDIEHGEVKKAKTRERVVAALKIVQDDNPGIEISITFGVSPTGPDATGRSLIAEAVAAGLQPTSWTIMPFDFGTPIADMGQASVQAAQGLALDVEQAYGISEPAAYEHVGISSMNGRTDEADETVTTSDFQTMLAFAQQHHLARFTFWSVNRDRQCNPPSSKASDSCSSISQSPYAFSDIVAGYTG